MLTRIAATAITPSAPQLLRAVSCACITTLLWCVPPPAANARSAQQAPTHQPSSIAYQKPAFATQPQPSSQAHAAPTAQPVRTLAAGWQQVRGLLLDGNNAAALQTLDTLATQFGQEPEYVAALPSLLPLHADLCLASGRAAEAVELYRRWLALPQTEALRTQRITVQEALANACEHSGDIAGVLAALQTLIELTPPQDPRNQLARLRSAALLAKSDRTGVSDERGNYRASTASQAQAGGTSGKTEAIAALRSLSEQADYPAALRTQARLRALYLSFQSNAMEDAANLLLNHRWDVGQMPELAQLSFAAIRVGEYLLHQQHPQDALQALSLATAPQRLLQLQRLRRADVARFLESQRRSLQSGRIQAAAAIQFLSLQLEQIDRQLEFLEQQPSSPAPLLYMKASALLQAERPNHAAILFAAAASEARLHASAAQATVAEATVAEATAAEKFALHSQYNRLLALHRAQRTQRLQAETDTFADAFPSHPLSRKAQSLKIESLLREKRYAQALQVLNALLADAPPYTEHPAPARPSTQESDLEARLYFQRGYANAFTANYEQARADFAATQDLATQPLLDWARYWRGQADMLAGNYARAEETFTQALPQIDAASPAFGYARFSHAQTLYATGATAQAYNALQAFLQDFPAHERGADARLLLAETLATSEKPSLAPDALRPLLSQAREPWAGQAALRSGEILSQLGDTAEAIAIYTRYLHTFNTPDVNTTTSGQQQHQGAYTQVLHRAVHTLQKQQEQTRAAHLISEALQAQGNNPAAGDFSIVLAHAFHFGFEPLSLTPPWHAQKAATQSYALWLDAARQAALAANLQTLYARLNLELGRHYASGGRSDLQQALLLQTAAEVRPANLDTAALSAVSNHLAEHNYSGAQAFLAELEHRYANAQQEPAALLYGRAQLALHDRDTARADELLRRLGADWPTHPLRAKALPMQAHLARQQGDSIQEKEHWLALLALSGSPTEAKAEALLQLARLHARAGELPEAINYYQRLYTLYRAQEKAMLAAYMESAALFETLGDTASALATYNELLNSADISLTPPIRAQAQAEQIRLSAPDYSPPAINPAVAGPYAAATPDTTQPVAAPRDDQATPRDNQTTQHSHKALRSAAAQSGNAHVVSPSALFAETIAQPPVSDAAWQALLRGPAQVQLIYGGTLSGDVISIRDGTLHLRLRGAEGGIGETALPLERVLRIDFNDEPLLAYADRLAASGETALAYACRKELYARRENAMPFLGIASLRCFANLAEDALQRNEPLLALRIASRSLDAIYANSEPASAAPHPLRTQLQDAELLGLWQFGLHDQAVDKAHALHDAQIAQTPGTWPEAGSALPFALLAAATLAAGDADAALELALYPIALNTGSAATNIPHFPTAYAVALAAATELRQDELHNALLTQAAAHGITPANTLNLSQSKH